MVVGLGSGSTARYAIRCLGELVRGGLRIRGLPTSETTRRLADSLGIPLVTFEDVARVDVAIDGADEVSPALDLIKGRGGALVREKIVASASGLFVVAVDESKCVDRLGSVPVPVEVVPFGWPVVRESLERLGGRVELRRSAGELLVTDNRNYVIDCRFESIDDPAALEQQINRIPGVVDNGLFVGMTGVLVIGVRTGTTVRRRTTKELEK